MNKTLTLKIRICMGSSCFARGNRRNLMAIKDTMQRHGMDRHSVTMEGCLCEARCASGPHLRINGKLYNGVDPSGVVQLLDAYCRNPDIEETSHA